MRFFLTFLLFLFTLFSLFVYDFLRKKNFYLDLDLDIRTRTVKELILNLERFFGLNLYLNFKDIKFEKIIKIEKGKVVVVSFKKRKKKKKFLLKNIPIREIPINLKIGHLDVWTGNEGGVNRVIVKDASLINNELEGEFLYTNLRSFTLNGSIKAKIQRDTLTLKDLLLDSEYFSAKTKGEIKRNTGEILAEVEIKEIRKENFTLSGTKINAKGTINLPVLDINAKAFVKDLIVRNKNYGSIEGIVKGNYELFDKLFLKGEAVNPEGTKIKFTYDVIPEGLLTFSFENLVVDKNTLGINREIRGEFHGNGKVDFKKMFVKVNAFTENLEVIDKKFKGDVLFSYNFSGNGSLNFEFKNSGYAKGNLIINKNKLEGEFSFNDFPVVFQDFNAYLSGEGKFKKGKIFEMEAKIFANNGQFRDFSLQRISSDVKIRDKEIEALVYYGNSFGFVKGKFDNLKGFIQLNNFSLEGKEKSIKISHGSIEFSIQGKSINSKGKLGDLALNLSNIYAKTELEFNFNKKNEKITLEGNGILNVRFKEKSVLENFKYSLLLLDNNLRIFGASKDSILRVVYYISGRSGEFYGKIDKKEFGISLNGEIKNKDVKANFEAFYALLREKIKIKGKIETKEDQVKISLFPTQLRGKRFNYRFNGLNVFLEKENLSVEFKGLDVSLLDKKLLSISPSKGVGTTKNFSFEPVKITGVLNGVLNIAYKGNLYLKSSGTLNLTLLSKHIGSLMKSQMFGKLDYEFVFDGNELKFLARNDEPVRINSLYFYEPFGSAMNLELRKDFFAFALTGWFREGFLNAYAISKNFRDFEVEFVYKNLPVKLKDGIRARIEADGKGKVVVKNFKEIFLTLDTLLDGYVKVKKLPEKKEEEKKTLPVEITLDINFKTENGLIVKLPEGRVYTALNGRIYGKLPEPYYEIDVVLKSGRLEYFGRKFFVKRSTVKLLKEKDKELTEFDFYLNTVSDGYKIFLLVHGTPENPSVYYFSEPPLSREQILFKLISGGVNEGILPVGTVLANELKALGYVKGTIERLFDVNVEIGIKTSSTGEVGALVKLKKKLGSYFSLYYQTASTKDKKDTFWGAEVRSPGSLDLGFSFNVYSDNTREYKLRYVREFDF
ncbi:translocation/assembly module TamB domain-containing protein [Aquifex aeolicus]|uniref:Uncharacterized protein aq_2054 n=1 Tax=Aquifex aeolicus (strain VF5) TaxID=224324 RepID=Y2054_AQUAE|nr:translocation/assembly module TamB domain-containing protein [Aquifex aeolicus]O67838.1 RecName: Full=Uncharacterized protein aq_2054 [Aquifex aeolicus VF5]AAC07805.1 putative protein [Aquifex aeolicus VF5]